MPRRLRLYQPGAIFHITARTQGRVAWFDEEMRDYVCDAIDLALARTDAKLRGYVIMPNHLHLIVQQWLLPLSSLMQPLLCRVALAVQRKCKATGHVFERRFWETVCPDPIYLRALIDYNHHNPVKAALCKQAADWEWSSARQYLGLERRQSPRVEPIGLGDLDVGFLRTNSDDYSVRARPRLDLRDVLLYELRSRTSGELNLDELRAVRGRRAAELRRCLVIAAGRLGYRGCDIARSLGISEVHVSKILSAAGVPRSRGIPESVND